MAGEGFKIADAYVQISAQDNTEATATEVQTRLGKMAATIKLNLDTAVVEAKIKLVQTYLDDLKSKDPNVKVDADIAAAEAKLEELKAKLDTLNNKTITVNVDTDKGVSGLAKLDTSNIKSLGLFTALTAGVGAAGAAMAAVPVSAAALGGVVGTLGVAFNGVSKAMEDYQKDLDKGKTSSEAFADATKNLNQPQKDFVTQLLATEKELKPLQEATAKAFFPGLIQAMKDSNALFPILQGFLTQTGTMLGDTAKKLGDLFKSSDFQKNLQTLLSSSQPVMKALVDMVVDLTTKLVDVGAKLTPVAQGFADFINKVKTGISGFFDELVPHADSFKQIFESLGTILQDLLPVIADIAGDIADSLAPALKAIADWMDANKDKIKPIIEAFAALWVTLKAAGLVSDVTAWVTGVVTQLGKLTTAIGKIPPGLGTAGLAVGTAVALGAAERGIGTALMNGNDPYAPGATDKTKLGSGAHTAGELFTGDWGEFGGDVSKQWDELPAQLAAAPQHIKDRLSGLGSNIAGMFSPTPGGGAATDGTLGSASDTSSTTDLVAKIKEAWQQVQTFFTQTIPQALKGDVLTKIKEAWTSVSNFFTQTIPQFFQQQVVQKLTTAWTAVANFFSQTIPQFFQTKVVQPLTTAWTTVTNFFTQTIPNFFKQNVITPLTTAWKVVSDFFTVTIPTFFKEQVITPLTTAWKVVSDFFTVTIPQFFQNSVVQPLTTAWKTVTDFFTVTIPQFFTSGVVPGITTAWTTVTNFFTQTIPNFFSQTVPQLLTTAWQAVTSTLTNLINSLGSAAAGGSGASGNAPSSATGNLFLPMASGGVVGGLTPMSGARATVVPPNTWRVVGDNMKHPELFAPLDGSDRSLGFLSMAASTFGKQLAPAGPQQTRTASSSRGGGGRPVTVNITQQSGSPAETGRMVSLALRTVA